MQLTGWDGGNNDMRNVTCAETQTSFSILFPGHAKTRGHKHYLINIHPNRFCHWLVRTQCTLESYRGLSI